MLSSRSLSVGKASLTSLDDRVARITDLVIGIEQKVSHTQVIAQGIRDQRPDQSCLSWHQQLYSTYNGR